MGSTNVKIQVSLESVSVTRTSLMNGLRLSMRRSNFTAHLPVCRRAKKINTVAGEEVGFAVDDGLEGYGFRHGDSEKVCGGI